MRQPLPPMRMPSIKPKTPDPERDGLLQNKPNKEDVEASPWLKKLDGLSSFISFVAFWVALGFGLSQNGSKGIRRFDDTTPIWRENVLVVNSDLNVSDRRNMKAEALINSFAGVNSALDGFCNGTRELYNETRVWDNKTYTGTAVILPAGSYSPWAVLMWIFFVSWVFQGARVIKKVGYDPLKPDFWRWVEYALTSPFQILLIGGSVFIHERIQIMNLMGLQAALVLVGYLNERLIDKFYKRARKGIPSGAEKVNFTRIMWLKLLLMLSLSWSFFVIIWYSIIQRFEEQKANLSDCEYVTKMPREVNFIVWSQAGLFGLFGAAQTVQALYTLGVKDRRFLTVLNKDLRGRIALDRMFLSGLFVVVLIWSVSSGWTPVVLVSIIGFVAYMVYSFFIPNDDIEDAANLRKKRWDSMAFRYSFLSVAAKTVLEVGFILLVRVREDMTE